MTEQRLHGVFIQDAPMCLHQVKQRRNVPAMSQGETLLTTRQVADHFGVTPQTVAKWVAVGRLTPALRAPGVRGSMFFSPDLLTPAAASPGVGGPALPGG